jgi:CRP-like cAMP-binding protein
MEAGQFFGEGCLNGHTARVATAVSVANGEITSITKSGMRELLKGTSKNSSPS